MRAILVAALLTTALGGCGKTRACKASTVLVHVDGSAADAADTLALDIAVGSGAVKTVTVAWKPGGGSVEIDFPNGYPRGQTVTITATATQAGSTLATSTASLTLDDTCKSLSLTLVANGGGGDGGADACVPMISACPAAACGTVDNGCGTMLDCSAPCQVNAADRVVAAATEKVTLEGRFSDPTVVTFPGGTTATATLLGANRATVVVPATAGEGALSVQSGNVAAGSLPFRRAPYTIDLQPFRGNYEQVERGQQMPQLTNSRYWTSAVAGDKYVFIIGGGGDTTSPTTVEQALINADGTIGAPTPSPNALTEKRAYAATIRLGNFLYVLGGVDGNDTTGAGVTSVSNSIERAPFNTDGTIGTFAVVPGVTLKASLTVGANTYAGLWGHAVVIIGDWLYVIGGNTGPFCAPMATTQVERAPIAADGSLGDFTVVTTALAVAEGFGPAAVSGGYVYVVSGTTIQSSPISPTGDLGAFADCGVTLAAGGPGPHGALYALGSKLFLLGGGGSGVESMVPHGDGTLATPVAGNAMFNGSLNFNFGSAIIGHYIYAFGGGDASACSAAFLSFNRYVTRASLDGSGALGPFAAINAINPSTPRSGMQTVVLGNHVYLIGGAATGQPDVDVATVGADGTLGNFAAATTSFVTKRAGAAIAVIGPWVYAFGGADPANGATLLSSVEAAPIAADGTLGTFAVAKIGSTATAVQLDEARVNGVAYVVPSDHTSPSGLKDTVCLDGGHTSSADGQTSCVAINNDGTLAAVFSAASPAAPMLVLRPDIPSAFVGDRVYLMAGNPMSSTNIEGAPYDLSTGKLSGAFVAGPTLTNQLNGRAGWSFGPILYMSGGANGIGTFASDIETSLVDASGSPAAFATSATMLGLGRLGHRAVVVGARVYIIGGTSSIGAVNTESAELR